MRWGRKKKPPSSSSSSSSFRVPSISHVLPIPWLLKFKGLSIDSDSKTAEPKLDGEQNLGSASSQRIESSSTRLLGREVAEDLKKIRVVRSDTDILPEVNIRERESRAIVIKTPRWLTVQDDQKCKRKANKKAGKEEGETKSLGKVNAKLEVLPVKTISMILEEKYESTRADERKYRPVSSSNNENNCCDLFTQNPDESYHLSPEEMDFDWKYLKEMKIKEVKAKTEQRHRKSLYISKEQREKRTKQNRKLRAFSPRASSKVEICRLEAINGTKKAKLKMKAQEERENGWGSFPVVKCSFDPQKDFRDSMVEMIVGNKLKRPEELEELLACYLTLNSDEYHDMITKVFQQVWFQLNQGYFETKN